MPWYMVVQTPDRDLRVDVRKNYRGIDGIVWPLDFPRELVDTLENEIYSNENECCFDLQLALRYFKAAQSTLRNIRLLRCSTIDEKVLDGDFVFIGYDYGDPRGGYSCIYDEILSGRHKEMQYWFGKLNEAMLFPGLQLVKEYVAFRELIKDRLKLEESPLYTVLRLDTLEK